MNNDFNNFFEDGMDYSTVEDKLFYNLPTSPTVDIIMKTLEYAPDLTRLNVRNKIVNHSQTIEVKGNKCGNIRVTESAQTSSVTLDFANVDSIISSNKPAKKLFIFALIKINAQAFSGGLLKREYIQFPLRELIDIGFYKSSQSARVGFRAASNVLTSLKISGVLRKGKNNTIEQSTIEVLFTGASIKNGTCTIHLNERVNWSLVAAFYTIIPNYYFKLSNRASDLLYYIFYMARQHIREIEESGCFNISLRAVHFRLKLPSVKGNKDPQRTIKEPIEAAIVNIEDNNNDLDFTITPIYNIEDPISDFLDNGYLKIELKNKYAHSFIKLSKEISRQISNAEKRRSKIIDNAKAINLAKKIE